MANVQPRYNKEGKIVSYSIRVHRGRGADGKQLKPYTATFEVQPTWTEKSARKKAEAFAAQFEKACKDGTATDTRKRFDEYCDYVIELKETRGIKHTTIHSYRFLTQRIYPEIGRMKLKDIRPEHLNNFYTKLVKLEKEAAYATAKDGIRAILKGKKITQEALSQKSGLPVHKIEKLVNRQRITKEEAEAAAAALGLPAEEIFDISMEKEKLSSTTVNAYHRLISAVLSQAEKEGLVSFNAAAKASPPPVARHEVQYFQPEEVAAIRDALEDEPIRWKTITHLFLLTGARRGEILGIRWDDVDFDNSRIHIHNNVIYRPDVGIYEDAPKTKSSIRWVSLPSDTMQLLRKYKIWQTGERLRLGEYYEDTGLVFAQDNGKPLHPDSVSTWLSRFSDRHGLPHINPHAFRHTMASMLYFNGIDSVSISKRLGHAKVSTTSDIYAHVIAEADRQNAEILESIYYKKPKKA